MYMDHKEVGDVLVKLQLKIDCVKIAFFGEEKRFLAEPVPNYPTSRNFLFLQTKIMS